MYKENCSLRTIFLINSSKKFYVWTTIPNNTGRLWLIFATDSSDAIRTTWLSSSQHGRPKMKRDHQCQGKIFHGLERLNFHLAALREVEWHPPLCSFYIFVLKFVGDEIVLVIIDNWNQPLSTLSNDTFLI